jgi:rare lipoprotein A
LSSTKGWVLSGRHAQARIPRLSRRVVPLVSAIAVAAVLIGGAVAALNLGPANDGRVTAADAAASTAASTVGGPSAAPSRSSAQRASRGEMRAMPSPTRSPSRTPSPSADPGTTSASGSGTCQASYYSDGQRTANGETFDPNALTAAHKTLPFNTRVRVTNRANGKSVVVRINDRGPFVAGRCLDLTTAAFKAIASLSSGVVTVAYQVLG